MASWKHGGGFGLDAGVRIEADDRPGPERLLRYCARPVFALERLRQVNSEYLVYESIKPGPGGSVSLLLTPLELIERLAAVNGVLAPNAPLRAAVAALAGAGAKDEASLPTATVPYMPDEVADEPAHLKAARYVWALLLANRVILQLDQAAPQDQKLLRHHRECRKNLNLDRHMRLRPHRDRQKASRPERQPLHNPTARQRHLIRENPY